VDGQAGGRPLLCRAVFGGDADGDDHAFGGQLMGQPPALGGAAENDDHFLYPRGVMSLPRSIRVEDAPTKTVVNISTSASCSWASVSRQVVWPARPMLRTQPQGVSGLRPASSRMPQARRSVSFRRREAGLYRQRTKSPATAARSRFSMTCQGVSRSDSETVQKSCPSGAPRAAAPARAAVTPGITSTSTAG